MSEKRDIWCWKCMKRTVSEVGEECNNCLFAAYQRIRRSYGSRRTETREKTHQQWNVPLTDSNMSKAAYQKWAQEQE